MKNMIWGIIAIIILCIGSISCNHKAPVTEIWLPDSLNVGRSMPVVSGSLAEYVEVIPGAYKLDLKDSIPELKVRLRTVKAREQSPLLASKINTDSTFVVLIDSMRGDIPDFALMADSMELKKLHTLLSQAGVTTELSFRGNPLSEGKKDTLSLEARNFHLCIAIQYDITPETVDQLLNEWKGLLRDLDSYVDHGCIAPMYINYYVQDFNRSHMIMKQLGAVEPMMTQDQKDRYKTLCRLTPKRSIV